MGSSYTPYLPPQYYQRLKNRMWRLFGAKVSPEMREEIIYRASHRLGLIRSTRFSRSLCGILKELYSDDREIFRDLIHARNPFMETIRGTA